MSEILEFGGALNYDLIPGFPRWVGLLIASVFIGIVIWYLWKRMFDNLHPVDGIYYAQATHYISGNPAFVIGKANELELATEKSVKMIFPDETYHEAIVYEPDWRKTCYTSCGGIDCDIVIDLADWSAKGISDPGFLSRDYPDKAQFIPIRIFQSILRRIYNTVLAPLFWWPQATGGGVVVRSAAHDAIEKAAGIWNENEIKSAQEKDPDAMAGADEIHSYLKFRDKLLKGEIVPAGLRDDQVWYTVSWQRIKAAFRMFDTVDSGGWVMQRGQEFNKDADGAALMDKYLLWVLLFFGFVFLCIVAAHGLGWFHG
jgi:hypothetical protein